MHVDPARTSTSNRLVSVAVASAASSGDAAISSVPCIVEKAVSTIVGKSRRSFVIPNRE